MQSWNANTHHFIILPLIIYHFLTIDCSEGKGVFGWFTDETCFFSVDRTFVKLLMIANGYFTADLLICHYLVRDPSPLSKLTKIHHVGCITGYFAVCFVGYATPGIGTLLLLCEISTIFMNYRMMIPKENMANTWPMLNQLAFFTCYTIFRIINFPYGLVLTIYEL